MTFKNDDGMHIAIFIDAVSVRSPAFPGRKVITAGRPSRRKPETLLVAI